MQIPTCISVSPLVMALMPERVEANYLLHGVESAAALT
jgi:hypothetical protein